MTKEMLHQLVEETCLRMFGCELREATEKQAYRALCVTVRMMLEDKQRAFQAETKEKERKQVYGEFAMSVSYDKLWKLLIDKKMNRTELKDAAGISFNVLAKMGKNEFISMESLYKICSTLQCNISDIVDFELKKEK